MTLEEQVGQLLVFGIPGTRVRPQDVRLFRETHAAGLILYRINFESPAQVRRLISDLENALGRRLLVTVDHEGGRVVMFGSGVTVFPDSLAFGLGGTASDARRHGEIEGRELRRLGVDVNFAPVADILTAEYSPNIGIRSYGADAARVAAFAAARIRGMQSRGLSACAKHFPGLGPATLDPHLALPVIRTTRREMQRFHLRPFESAIRAGVDLVMSSHPLYPNLEPSRRTPATFSRRLITGLLRNELGYRGVIASDDLEMGAIRKLAPVGRAAVLAVRAGHDLVLSCHDAVAQRRVQRALLEAFRSGELPRRGLEGSVERIAKLRAKRARRFEAGSPRAEPAGAALAGRIARNAARAAIKTSSGPEFPAVFAGKPRVSAGTWKGRGLIVFPRLAEFAKKIMVERELAAERSFLRSAGAPPADVAVVPVDPAASAAASLASKARRAPWTVFFCQDAHMYPGCRRLLKGLTGSARKLAVVLLRDPYDEALVPPGVPIVTAFGYRAAQLRAAVSQIFGKRVR